MSRSARLAVVVAALGYFVDLYDLVLFSILRVPSLKSLGVLEGAVTSTGGLLLDLQLGGMLLGGILWGMLGDRRGRLTVLFGSIVMYSLANLGNAWVHDVTWYGVCRVFAGLGLAGELGAGITLVSELLPRERRGLGTTIVASLGLSGAVAAGLIAETLLSRFGDEGWRYAYGLGGVMGLLLLVLRVGVLESGLYAQTAKATVNRGDPRVLLSWRFLRIVLVGMPIWFAGGVLFVFSPEIGGALGLSPKPTGGQTIFWAYTGVVAGDVASGLLSQSLGSRKRVLWLFLGALALSTTAVLTLGGRSLGAYYWLMCLLGATTGYWVLCITTAAEQFGTNQRATVTTSAPNFVRATAISITAIWFALKPALGVIPATLSLGLGCLLVAAVALWSMPESFAVDLDYLESPDLPPADQT
jgi:predicted MFS family arabinose efflux permease